MIFEKLLRKVVLNIVRPELGQITDKIGRVEQNLDQWAGRISGIEGDIEKLERDLVKTVEVLDRLVTEVQMNLTAINSNARKTKELERGLAKVAKASEANGVSIDAHVQSSGNNHEKLQKEINRLERRVKKLEKRKDDDDD